MEIWWWETPKVNTFELIPFTVYNYVYLTGFQLWENHQKMKNLDVICYLMKCLSIFNNPEPMIVEMEKVRVQGLAFSTRFFSVDHIPGFGSNDMIFVFFHGFFTLFHQNFVFFVKFLSMFIIRKGLGFSFCELLVDYRVWLFGAQFRAPLFHPKWWKSNYYIIPILAYY